MKRSDDPTGLQFLFTGVLAIGVLIYLAGAFAYRLYTQHFDHHATDDQDEQA
jgi:hypothetical protein